MTGGAGSNLSGTEAQLLERTFQEDSVHNRAMDKSVGGFFTRCAIEWYSDALGEQMSVETDASGASSSAAPVTRIIPAADVLPGHQALFDTIVRHRNDLIEAGFNDLDELLRFQEEMAKDRLLDWTWQEKGHYLVLPNKQALRINGIFALMGAALLDDARYPENVLLQTRLENYLLNVREFKAITKCPTGIRACLAQTLEASCYTMPDGNPLVLNVEEDLPYLGAMHEHATQLLKEKLLGKGYYAELIESIKAGESTAKIKTITAADRENPESFGALLYERMLEFVKSSGNYEPPISEEAKAKLKELKKEIPLSSEEKIEKYVSDFCQYPALNFFLNGDFLRKLSHLFL